MGGEGKAEGGGNTVGGVGAEQGGACTYALLQSGDRGCIVGISSAKQKLTGNLAVWEARGKLKAVITQNIDGLHQLAGSKNVLELHGSVHRNYCERCHKFYDAEYMLHTEGVPKCSCGGTIKPDVVLYEEGLDNRTLTRAVEYISRADVLIIGGTSLAVYPAAGLIDYYEGNKLVLVNKTPTSRDAQADLVVQGSIGEIFSRL